MSEVTFGQVKDYLGLDGDRGVASSWPDFDDGRKGRIFIQDPRLDLDEGDNTDSKLYRQVICEFLQEMLEHFQTPGPAVKVD